jgi:nucleoside-diphosphate-sugar epimerase
LNKKVVITGGSGFLGINLVRHLKSKGITDITSIDLAEFDYPEKSEINEVTADIRDAAAMEKAIAGADWVIHTAAALPLYTEHEIMTTDLDGTRNVIAAAHKAGADRFVHVSSTAVYGIPDHHPLCEDDKLIGVGPYGIAKIEAEKVCFEFRDKGQCVSVIRPKSFIGPERLGVFALFYDWAMDGKNFPMIGSGNNRYQLLDVEDLCESIWLCLTVEKYMFNDTINIGDKVFTSMKVV